jgi:hypothetical protein
MASVGASSRVLRGERSAGWAGIAFVALSTLWAVVQVSVGPPELGKSSTEGFTSFYGDQGNRISLILATLSLALAGFALLWFLGGLRSVLRCTEGETGTLSTTAMIAGVVLVGLLFVFTQSKSPFLGPSRNRTTSASIRPRRGSSRGCRT